MPLLHVRRMDTREVIAIETTSSTTVEQVAAHLADLYGVAPNAVVLCCFGAPLGGTTRICALPDRVEVECRVLPRRPSVPRTAPTSARHRRGSFGMGASASAAPSAATSRGTSPTTLALLPGAARRSDGAAGSTYASSAVSSGAFAALLDDAAAAAVAAQAAAAGRTFMTATTTSGRGVGAAATEGLGAAGAATMGMGAAQRVSGIVPVPAAPAIPLPPHLTSAVPLMVRVPELRVFVEVDGYDGVHPLVAISTDTILDLQARLNPPPLDCDAALCDGRLILNACSTLAALHVRSGAVITFTTAETAACLTGMPDRWCVNGGTFSLYAEPVQQYLRRHGIYPRRIRGPVGGGSVGVGAIANGTYVAFASTDATGLSVQAPGVPAAVLGGPQPPVSEPVIAAPVCLPVSAVGAVVPPAAAGPCATAPRQRRVSIVLNSPHRSVGVQVGSASGPASDKLKPSMVQSRRSGTNSPIKALAGSSRSSSTSAAASSEDVTHPQRTQSTQTLRRNAAPASGGGTIEAALDSPRRSSGVSDGGRLMRRRARRSVSSARGGRCHSASSGATAAPEATSSRRALPLRTGAHATRNSRSVSAHADPSSPLPPPPPRPHTTAPAETSPSGSRPQSLLVASLSQARVASPPHDSRAGQGSEAAPAGGIRDRVMVDAAVSPFPVAAIVEMQSVRQAECLVMTPTGANGTSFPTLLGAAARSAPQAAEIVAPTTIKQPPVLAAAAPIISRLRCIIASSAGAYQVPSEVSVAVSPVVRPELLSDGSAMGCSRNPVPPLTTTETSIGAAAPDAARAALIASPLAVVPHEVSEPLESPQHRTTSEEAPSPQARQPAAESAVALTSDAGIPGSSIAADPRDPSVAARASAPTSESPAPSTNPASPTRAENAVVIGDGLSSHVSEPLDASEPQVATRGHSPDDESPALRRAASETAASSTARPAEKTGSTPATGGDAAHAETKPLVPVTPIEASSPKIVTGLTEPSPPPSACPVEMEVASCAQGAVVVASPGGAALGAEGTLPRAEAVCDANFVRPGCSEAFAGDALPAMQSRDDAERCCPSVPRPGVHPVTERPAPTDAAPNSSSTLEEAGGGEESHLVSEQTPKPSTAMSSEATFNGTVITPALAATFDAPAVATSADGAAAAAAAAPASAATAQNRDAATNVTADDWDEMLHEQLLRVEQEWRERTASRQASPIHAAKALSRSQHLENGIGGAPASAARQSVSGASGGRGHAQPSAPGADARGASRASVTFSVAGGDDPASAARSALGGGVSNPRPGMPPLGRTNSIARPLTFSDTRMSVPGGFAGGLASEVPPLSPGVGASASASASASATAASQGSSLPDAPPVLFATAADAGAAADGTGPHSRPSLPRDAARGGGVASGATSMSRSVTASGASCDASPLPIGPAGVPPPAPLSGLRVSFAADGAEPSPLASGGTPALSVSVAEHRPNAAESAESSVRIAPPSAAAGRRHPIESDSPLPGLAGTCTISVVPDVPTDVANGVSSTVSDPVAPRGASGGRWDGPPTCSVTNANVAVLIGDALMQRDIGTSELRPQLRAATTGYDAISTVADGAITGDGVLLRPIDFADSGLRADSSSTYAGAGADDRALILPTPTSGGAARPLRFSDSKCSAAASTAGRAFTAQPLGFAAPSEPRVLAFGSEVRSVVPDVTPEGLRPFVPLNALPLSSVGLLAAAGGIAATTSNDAAPSSSARQLAFDSERRSAAAAAMSGVSAVGYDRAQSQAEPGASTVGPPATHVNLRAESQRLPVGSAEAVHAAHAGGFGSSSGAHCASGDVATHSTPQHTVVTNELSFTASALADSSPAATTADPASVERHLPDVSTTGKLAAAVPVSALSASTATPRAPIIECTDLTTSFGPICVEPAKTPIYHWVPSPYASAVRAQAQHSVPPAAPMATPVTRTGDALSRRPHLPPPAAATEAPPPPASRANGAGGATPVVSAAVNPNTTSTPLAETPAPGVAARAASGVIDSQGSGAATDMHSSARPAHRLRRVERPAFPPPIGAFVPQPVIIGSPCDLSGYDGGVPVFTAPGRLGAVGSAASADASAALDASAAATTSILPRSALPAALAASAPRPPAIAAATESSASDVGPGASARSAACAAIVDDTASPNPHAGATTGSVSVPLESVSRAFSVSSASQPRVARSGAARRGVSGDRCGGASGGASVTSCGPSAGLASLSDRSAAAPSAFDGPTRAPSVSTTSGEVAVTADSLVALPPSGVVDRSGSVSNTSSGACAAASVGAFDRRRCPLRRSLTPRDVPHLRAASADSSPARTTAGSPSTIIACTGLDGPSCAAYFPARSQTVEVVGANPLGERQPGTAATLDGASPAAAAPASSTRRALRFSEPRCDGGVGVTGLNREPSVNVSGSDGPQPPLGPGRANSLDSAAVRAGGVVHSVSPSRPRCGESPPVTAPRTAWRAPAAGAIRWGGAGSQSARGSGSPSTLRHPAAASTSLDRPFLPSRSRSAGSLPAPPGVDGGDSASPSPVLASHGVDTSRLAGDEDSTYALLRAVPPPLTAPPSRIPSPVKPNARPSAASVSLSMMTAVAPSGSRPPSRASMSMLGAAGGLSASPSRIAGDGATAAVSIGVTGDASGRGAALACNGSAETSVDDSITAASVKCSVVGDGGSGRSGSAPSVVAYAATPPSEQRSEVFVRRCVPGGSRPTSAATSRSGTPSMGRVEGQPPAAPGACVEPKLYAGSTAAADSIGRRVEAALLSGGAVGAAEPCLPRSVAAGYPPAARPTSAASSGRILSAATAVPTKPGPADVPLAAAPSVASSRSQTPVGVPGPGGDVATVPRRADSTTPRATPASVPTNQLPALQHTNPLTLPRPAPVSSRGALAPGGSMACAMTGKPISNVAVVIPGTAASAVGEPATNQQRDEPPAADNRVPILVRDPEDGECTTVWVHPARPVAHLIPFIEPAVAAASRNVGGTQFLSGLRALVQSPTAVAALMQRWCVRCDGVEVRDPATATFASVAAGRRWCVFSFECRPASI